MRRLALLVLVLAGCGGSGPSEEEFAEEANRICREGEATVGRTVEQLQARTDADSQEITADVLERSAEEYEPYMDRLREVEAPDELEGEWAAFLRRIEEAFGLFPRLAEATRSGDREELSELTTRFAQIADDTRPFAQRHGLNACLPD
jgi:sigma54-dependent transcription regulator